MLPLKGSYRTIRDWVSSQWRRWAGYLEELHHHSEELFVPGTSAHRENFPDAPRWKEHSVSTEIMMGLLLHWGTHLAPVVKGVSLALLRGLLSKAVPTEPLVWHATLVPEAAAGGPHAERLQDLHPVRVENQLVCLNDMAALLERPERGVLRQSAPKSVCGSWVWFLVCWLCSCCFLPQEGWAGSA